MKSLLTVKDTGHVIYTEKWRFSELTWPYSLLAPSVSQTWFKPLLSRFWWDHLAKAHKSYFLWPTEEFCEGQAPPNGTNIMVYQKPHSGNEQCLDCITSCAYHVVSIVISFSVVCKAVAPCGIACRDSLHLLQGKHVSCIKDIDGESRAFSLAWVLHCAFPVWWTDFSQSKLLFCW